MRPSPPSSALKARGSPAGVRVGAIVTDAELDLSLWEAARRLPITHVPAAPRSTNLGDDIQTEAGRRWFGAADTVDRDRPRSWPKGACVALCGWWALDFLPPPGVRAVLVGMHMDRRCRQALTPKGWERIRAIVEWQGFPMGCRDTATLAAALRHGIDAGFSGCVTQVLARADADRRTGRYAVECSPPDPSWQFVTHRLPWLARWSVADRLAFAAGQLERYARAEALATSKLHAYLPAVALGVPSVSWRFDDPPMNPLRLTGHCPDWSLSKA